MSRNLASEIFSLKGYVLVVVLYFSLSTVANYLI